MFTLIITSFNEVENTKKLIHIVSKQLSKNDQLILASPNLELKDFLENKRYQFQKTFIKDPQKGKPYALNLALKKAEEKFIICTDGDIILRDSSIREILKPFSDKEVGLVSGRPISLDDKNSLLGFWSHFLTHAAHVTRQKRENNNEFISASGYLLAFRNFLIESIPSNTLVDDAWISHSIFRQGYKIAYAPLAKVEVYFPKNFSDWMKQKLRSVGGYNEKYIQESTSKMRSFKNESILGLKLIFTYPKTLKEYFFTMLLVIARVYLWILITWKFKVKKSQVKWVRIESSKS